MGKFKLEFSTDNAAFDDNGIRWETERILRWVADQVELSTEGGSVRDINGNTVGSFSFVNEAE